MDRKRALEWRSDDVGLEVEGGVTLPGGLVGVDRCIWLQSFGLRVDDGR